MTTDDTSGPLGRYARFLKFAVVGASGVLVNVVLFWIAAELLFTKLDASSRILASSSFAISLSILSNFILNDIWTWRDRREPGARAFGERMFKYVLVASGAGLIQLIIAWVLAVPLDLNHTVMAFLGWLGEWVRDAVVSTVGAQPGEHAANLIGIVAGAVVNFVVNNAWTFRKKDTTPNDEQAAEPAAETEQSADPLPLPSQKARPFVAESSTHPQTR